MTTLAPPEVKEAAENSIEKKVYSVVENLKEFLPLANDRNRLGFCLYKFVKGEGDDPKILVHSTKIKIEGITPEQLAEKIISQL